MLSTLDLLNVIYYKKNVKYCKFRETDETYKVKKRQRSKLEYTKMKKTVHTKTNGTNFKILPKMIKFSKFDQKFGN